MKHFLVGLGMGLLGIAVALGLTLGTLAIAGPKVGGPPSPPDLHVSTQPSPSPSSAQQGDKGSNHAKDDDPSDHGTGAASPTPTWGSPPTHTASPSGGDHGDDSRPAHSGSEDHGGDD